MLKVFRDNLKTFAPVLWIVIVAFILIEFSIFGNNQMLGDNVAAEVGGQEISMSDYQRASENMASRYRQIYGDQWSSELAEQLQINQQALESLVRDEILRMEAERLGLEATDEEVREFVLESFVDESGRFMGEERYQLLANRNYGGTAQLENLVRKDLLRLKMIQVLTENAWVSDADVEQAYRDQVERATIRYIQQPRAELIPEVTLTEADLASHYEANQETYRLPEQRVAAYLLVDQSMLRLTLEVPEEELRSYYEANQGEFERPEQVRARHILLQTNEERTAEQAQQEIAAARARIEGGEDFAAVAREVSEDQASAPQGGDLGFFGRGRMVPEFEEAAFDASQGELVTVTSPFGIHLIEVTDRREGGVAAFEEVQGEVRNRLAVDRVEPEAQRIAGELTAALAEEEVTTDRLRALADDYPAVRFVETAPFGAEDAITGIGRAPELVEAAFAMEPGEVTEEPVVTGRGPALLYLIDVREPRLPELSEVEPRLRRELEQERAQELALARMEEAKERLDAGESLDEVAADLGLQVQESTEFSKGGPIQGLGVAPEINQAAMAAEVGDLVGPLRTLQGALVFEVTDRVTFDPAVFETEKATTRATLEQQEGQRLLTTMLQERRRQLGVQYNPQLSEQFENQAAQGGGLPGF